MRSETASRPATRRIGRRVPWVAETAADLDPVPVRQVRLHQHHVRRRLGPQTGHRAGRVGRGGHLEALVGEGPRRARPAPAGRRPRRADVPPCDKGRGPPAPAPGGRRPPWGMLPGREAHPLGPGREQARGPLPRRRALHRRGYNIDSLAVSPTEEPDLSRMTITVNASRFPVEQITKQLDKLINVIKIRDLDPENMVVPRARADEGAPTRARAARSSSSSRSSRRGSSTSRPSP